MKTLKNYINESITCEDVFNVNKSGDELLLNKVVGETNDVTLIITKTEGKRIFIGPSDKSMESKKSAVVCNDTMRELIEGFDIDDIMFEYKYVDISCLSGFKKRIRIIGQDKIRFNGELENATISCIYLALLRSTLIKNCKISCDHLSWGNAGYEKSSDGYFILPADYSDEIKVPFVNCNIRASIQTDLYYTYECWEEVRRLRTLKDKDPSEFFGFGKQLKSPYICCSFDTWTKLHQHSALHLSKNYNVLKKLKLSWPRESINGWYYVDELMDLDLY